MTECLLRQNWNAEAQSILPARACKAAHDEMRSWPTYTPTELRPLLEAASEMNIGSVLYKDESMRFGLGSFKALGAPYALARTIRRHLKRRRAWTDGKSLFRRGAQHELCNFTAACATDGNHGRALAWASSQLGCECVIYVPSFVSDFRRRAIESFGATVTLVEGTYDDAAALAERDALERDWMLISDSGVDRHSVAALVMAGYTLVVEEAFQEFRQPITHCFVQAGVGGLAAAVAEYFSWSQAHRTAKIIVVEPENAAGLFASAVEGRLTPARGSLSTIAGGLSCGLPSPIAWQILERKAYAFMTVSDEQIIKSMAYLSSQGITGGESGVVGLAGLMCAAVDSGLRRQLVLDETSNVLLIGTEGATDPQLYERILASMSVPAKLK